MRRVAVVLAAGLFVVATAGCTTKKDTGDAGGSSTTSSTRASQENSGTSTPSSDSADDASTAEQCQAVLVLMGGLSVGGALPEGQVRDDLEQKLADARTKVPDSLQDDVQVIADGVQDADGIAEWGRFVTSREYRDAVGNLQQYLSDNCGADDLLPS